MSGAQAAANMNGTQEKGLQLARGLDSFIEGGVSCTDEPSALQTSPLDHPQPAPAEHKPEEQQQQKPRAKAPLVLSSHPPPPCVTARSGCSLMKPAGPLQASSLACPALRGTPRMRWRTGLHGTRAGLLSCARGPPPRASS